MSSSLILPSLIFVNSSTSYNSSSDGLECKYCECETTLSGICNKLDANDGNKVSQTTSTRIVWCRFIVVIVICINWHGKHSNIELVDIQISLHELSKRRQQRIHLNWTISSSYLQHGAPISFDLLAMCLQEEDGIRINVRNSRIWFVLVKVEWSSTYPTGKDSHWCMCLVGSVLIFPTSGLDPKQNHSSYRVFLMWFFIKLSTNRRWVNGTQLFNISLAVEMITTSSDERIQ